MTQRQLLVAAAKRIEQGWCQGALSDGNKVCAWGGLMEVTRAKVSARSALIEKVLQVLGIEVPRELARYALIAWNDAPGRTQAEVVRAFRKAARI